MALDEQIDQLYRLPLSEFTAARNALAKTVARPDGAEDAKRIRALPKPTLVPWTVNQLFWNARLVYQRLMKSGETLRTAQIAALNGRAQTKPDQVKRAVGAHRDALAEAVRQAMRLAGAAGAKPDADELSRTLESLSLATTRPERPGRLTEPVRPAGFEALAGVSPAGAASLVGSASLVEAGAGCIPPAAEKAPARAGAHKEQSDSTRAEDAKCAQEAAAAAAAQRQRDEEIAAQKRKAEAALNAAQQDFERRKADEAAAREALDHAERAREEAHERLVAARKFLASNF